MDRWLRTRIAPAMPGGAANDRGKHGKYSTANSAKAPGGTFSNALNIALTLKQRLAVVTCRQEERGAKFFDLRKKYVRTLCACPALSVLPVANPCRCLQITLLRQNQAEHKVGGAGASLWRSFALTKRSLGQEQIGAIGNLRTALHKAGISPDNPRSRSHVR